MADSGRLGKVLQGKYRLDEELGRGGMGTVYKAFHLLVHKEFAVKVLNAELAEHKKVAQRFFLEAQAAGRIGHLGILDVYDVGEDDDGRPYMVMELLKGEPLSALVARGPLGVDEACWIASQVLEILVAAHDAGVVHRDVKPQNVFLVTAGEGRRRIKLLDFGIAKFITDGGSLTHSGEIIGSPLYMAPEQAKGEPDVDARADVWSVGAMLYEMLTGRCAHSATSAIAVLAKILTEQVTPPSSRRETIPKKLDEIVVSALTIDRAARIATAREMLDALAGVRSALGTADTIPTFSAPPPRVVRVGDDREDQVGVATSTVASRPPPQKSAPSSLEPPMEAAVTNGTMSTTRSKPIVIVAALATIAGAAALIFLGPWGGSTQVTPAAHLPESAAPTPIAIPSTPPSETASTAAIASAPASASASASSTPIAAREAGLPPIAPPRPTCAANETLTSGHCCPRGLSWQSTGCARPLATSF